jgi:hypothetical protein
MNYLAEIKWETDPDTGESFYHHPGMVFDLRTLGDQGVPNRTAGKFVLCAGPVVPVGAIEIGETGHVLTPGAKASVRSVLNIGESIVANTVSDLVRELVYDLASFNGVGRWKMGGRLRLGRNVRIVVADIGLDRVLASPADSMWQKTLALEQSHYAMWRAQARAAAQALQDAGRTWEQVQGHLKNRSLDQVDRDILRLGAPDRHLTNLGGQVRKYGVSYHEFRGGLPDEGVRAPETTITESFNTADSSTLGPDLAWTELIGDWEVFSNAARNDSLSGGNARADSDLSSDDHYCLFTVVAETAGSALGNAARMPATATDTMYYWRNNESANVLQMYKRVTGTQTQLGSNVSLAPSIPYTTRLECTSADTVLGYTDGTLRITISAETSITGNVRCGMRDAAALLNSSSLDTFEAADSAAATFDLDRIERRTMRGVMRGVGRGQ